MFWLRPSTFAMGLAPINRIASTPSARPMGALWPFQPRRNGMTAGDDKTRTAWSLSINSAPRCVRERYFTPGIDLPDVHFENQRQWLILPHGARSILLRV